MIQYLPHTKISRSVKIWLIIGLILIFFQVILGGITRLTGSGLSITKWEIVTGTLPPLDIIEWEEEFKLYQQTPQYSKINKGMTLSEFKFIYFWEYFHRLWARSMGFIFIIPFFYFWLSGKFSKKLTRQLVILVLLAVLVASIGWIMVASGLVNRPWVNAYKLSFHLSLAFILYGFLFWMVLDVNSIRKKVINNTMLKKHVNLLFFVLVFQIVVGGIMSGMKAGLWYPTFPAMNGEWIPSIVFTMSEWNVENFVNYDQNAFMPTLIQVVHRLLAIVLVIITLSYFYKAKTSENTNDIRRANVLWITMLIIQFIVGILTVIHCKGSIPLTYGVLHQAGALLLLMAVLNLNFVYSTNKSI